ncbi:hypothetical protein FPHYL_3019 [Fusarium phyllophilum]|uniref:HNH nuclease domain-containing protein n=1 Tax=Fusarium phyllophilum TaxID=47803 RepID=A0A8H5K8H2_9HYPO|nr:hypothetical protein FPHYL_3019 [Fusarium phyllophilum]
MATSAITPECRALGWNVVFYCGRFPRKFAGIFQAEGSDLITFRDVVDEMRLCFQFQAADTVISNNEFAHRNNAAADSDVSTGYWDDIVFALMDRSDQSSIPNLINKDIYNTPVPSLAQLSSDTQDIIKYHVYIHRTCSLPVSSPLADHLRDQCAQHLSEPTRKHHPRYLPPNKSSRNSKIAAVPLRNKDGSHRAALAAASGSEPANIVVPDDARMCRAYITQRMTDFRDNCCMRSSSCAVSGEGEFWVEGRSIGPGVEACHIVPQAQYHLYPTDQDPEANRGPPDLSLSNLLTAWEKTWSADNGIMLMKHLRYFFDLRLFSIHPDTHRMRSFVPYSPITRYNGKKARIHEDVDRNALQHHYDMCCIENMGARIDFTSGSGPATLFAYPSEISTPSSESGSTSRRSSEQQAAENQELLDKEDTIACHDRDFGYLTLKNSGAALKYVDERLEAYRCQMSE